MHTIFTMPRTTVRLRKGIPPDLEGLKPSGDAWRHDNIGRLLIVAFHAFGERVVQGIHESGHPEIRFVHLNLFRTVDYAQGTRLVDLARRNGIGKAAMGQLAREGERLGLFSITSDASDGRAKIVRITSKGRALHKVIGRELLRSEREFAAMLGRNRYAALRDGLLTLRRKLAEQFPSGFSQEEQP
jgi:DNA-binding MarR family transcriptional regulator